MNDYWNDPPDEPDIDEDELGLPSPNYDTMKDYRMDIEPEFKWAAEWCPHGNEWDSCDRCDFESDLAYDRWREKR